MGTGVVSARRRAELNRRPANRPDESLTPSAHATRIVRSLQFGRVGDRASRRAQATEHFHEHGYVIVPGYLSEDDLAPAQAELELMFPTAEEYQRWADRSRTARSPV